MNMGILGEIGLAALRPGNLRQLLQALFPRKSQLQQPVGQLPLAAGGSYSAIYREVHRKAPLSL